MYSCNIVQSVDSFLASLPLACSVYCGGDTKSTRSPMGCVIGKTHRSAADLFKFRSDTESTMHAMCLLNDRIGICLHFCMYPIITIPAFEENKTEIFLEICRRSQNGNASAQSVLHPTLDFIFIHFHFSIFLLFSSHDQWNMYLPVCSVLTAHSSHIGCSTISYEFRCQTFLTFSAYFVGPILGISFHFFAFIFGSRFPRLSLYSDSNVNITYIPPEHIYNACSIVYHSPSPSGFVRKTTYRPRITIRSVYDK